MKIEIKNRWSGETIFTHEAKENNIRITLEAATAAKINLRGSDLRGSNLRGSDLRGSNLSYSNLSYSNLRDSNLSDSDLSYSDLSDSNLSYSNLSGSNLSDSKVDFSSGWAFQCACSRFKIGIGFAYQVLAHLCSCTSDDAKFSEIRKMILPYAQKSHRARDLGILGEGGGKNDVCEATTMTQAEGRE